jgi:hypothetical protein
MKGFSGFYRLREDRPRSLRGQGRGSVVDLTRFRVRAFPVGVKILLKFNTYLTTSRPQPVGDCLGRRLKRLHHFLGYGFQR